MGINRGLFTSNTDLWETPQGSSVFGKCRRAKIAQSFAVKHFLVLQKLWPNNGPASVRNHEKDKL